MITVKKVILTCLPTGLLFLLKKAHYLQALKAFSEKDESDLKVVKRLVKEGDHVVDIGANVGWYTKTLSELIGNQGQVYSIEPIAETFELLSFCVRKLKLSNVKLLNCGVSESDGRSVMHVPKYESGGDNFYQARILTPDRAEIRETPRESQKHYEVALRSLDSLFGDSSPRIGLIKCDVEGHEFPVVKGATKLIASFRPAWLIEISGDPDSESSDASQLFRVLEGEGYVAWLFDGHRLKRRRAGDKSVNYFFLTESHINLVKDLILS